MCYDFFLLIFVGCVKFWASHVRAARTLFLYDNTAAGWRERHNIGTYTQGTNQVWIYAFTSQTRFDGGHKWTICKSRIVVRASQNYKNKNKNREKKSDIIIQDAPFELNRNMIESKSRLVEKRRANVFVQVYVDFVCVQMWSQQEAKCTEHMK